MTTCGRHQVQVLVFKVAAADVCILSFNTSQLGILLWGRSDIGLSIILIAERLDGAFDVGAPPIQRFFALS